MHDIAFSFLGGIGNTMFQAATAISLAIDNNCSVSVINEHQGYLHTQNKVYLNGLFRNIPQSKDYSSYAELSENRFNFSPLVFPNRNCRLNGYFQSEKYFAHNYKHIAKAFAPSEQTEESFHKLFPGIGSFVSIHVRRGNYVALKHIHRNLDKEYYEKAISLFPDDNFIVFSDDIEYCKTIFQGHRFFFFEEKWLDIDCLHLMSKCKHNIIANSTFSWWGAWLNLNIGRKVISPSQWFTNETDALNSRDLQFLSR